MRVEPRLQYRARGSFVDVRARLLAAHLARGERPHRLNCGEPFIPEFDGAPCCVGDALRERPRGASRCPFSAAQVERKADDEHADVFFCRKAAQFCIDCPSVASVECSARVSEQPELVVDGYTDAYPPRVEPACSAGTALRRTQARPHSVPRPRSQADHGRDPCFPGARPGLGGSPS